MNGGRVKARLIILGVLSAVLALTAALALWMIQGARVGGGGADERPLEGLKVFGTVPPFSLIEQSGKPVTREDLTGKVWIANFFYTHCPATCPLQTANMARLQRDLTDVQDLRLVSVTIDPERDTPAVLSEYADRYGADPARWLLLTGEKEAIYRLARSGGGAVRRSIGPRGYRRGENAPGGARSIGPMPGGSPIRSSPSAQGSGRTYRSSGQRGAHPTLS